MSSAKPPVTVNHPDHQVITPDPTPLRKALVPASPGDVDPVLRAEKALGGLSHDFAQWMADDCERLDVARAQIRATGMTAESRNMLLHAADDIKGNASTLGFQAAAPIADSLFRLIEHTPDAQRVPLELIDQHVDAIRAIVREHGRKDINAIASVLTSRLREVTEEFLRQENRHRPEYLQAIASPRLAPGDPF